MQFTIFKRFKGESDWTIGHSYDDIDEAGEIIFNAAGMYPHIEYQVRDEDDTVIEEYNR